MKVHFYCSYNMSPVGYQRVLFEPENGGQSLHGSDCATVEDLLLHGGAKSVFGLDENTYYFVLKDLRETRQYTAPDAPGRRWYMNLAVTVPARELKTLCAIAYEAYTQSQAFSARLAACLTAQDQACSYAVDTAKWNALTEAACRRYDAFAASGEPEISDTPCGLAPERLDAAFRLLRTQEITGVYEFALLEGSVSYFLGETRDPTGLWNYVTIGAEETESDEELPAEPEWFWPIVAAAGCLMLAACLYRHSKTRRAKREPAMLPQNHPALFRCPCHRIKQETDKGKRRKSAL